MQLAVGDAQRRAGVAGDVAQPLEAHVGLLERRRRIRRAGDRAEAHEGEEGDDELEAGGQDDEHAIAPPHVARLEHGGEGARLVVEAAVGETGLGELVVVGKQGDADALLDLGRVGQGVKQRRVQQPELVAGARHQPGRGAEAEILDVREGRAEDVRNLRLESAWSPLLHAPNNVYHGWNVDGGRARG